MEKFYEFLSSEFKGMHARIEAEHRKCLSTLQDEIASVKADNEKLVSENARLRESVRGGDPDSAAGCPHPRTVPLPLEMPPTLVEEPALVAPCIETSEIQDISSKDLGTSLMDRPPDVANTKEFHVSSPSKRLSAPMMGHRDSWESDSSDEEVAPNHSSSLQVTSKGVLTLRQMQDVDSLRKSVQMAVDVPEDKEPTYSSQMSAEPMTQTLSLLNLPNLSMRIPGVPGAAPIDSAFDASRRDSTVSTTSHARKSGDFTPLAGSRRESLARKRRRSQSLPGTRRASFMNMESLAELASIGSVVEKKLSLDSGGSEETYGNKTE
jgi:hypothetical protein